MLFYQAAEKLNLPNTYLPYIDYLSIQLGQKNYYFTRTLTPMNQGSSIFIAQNKHVANALLGDAGFCVPKAILLSQERYLQQPLAQLLQGINFPLVAKPVTGTSRGLDVRCNITNINSLEKYLKNFFQTYQTDVQIEEFHQNLKEYRVLILKNRVIGVVERFAAHVIGDGQQTIESLIAQSNKERDHLNATLTMAPIVVDDEIQQCMEEQHLSLQSIVPKDKKITLCYTVNTGRGGDIFSHGNKIHSQNAKQLIRAAKLLGLTYVGFDVLCEDINLSFHHTKWMIIEANFHPDITIHEVPNRGKRARVVNKVLLQLILQHPFFYGYHLMLKSKFSVYVKSGLIVSITCFLLMRVWQQL